MEYILFLDRKRNHLNTINESHLSSEIVVARSSEEAKAFVSKNGIPVFMYLDFELGFTEDSVKDTVMPFLEWLARTSYKIKPPQYAVLANGAESSWIRRKMEDWLITYNYVKQKEKGTNLT